MSVWRDMPCIPWWKKAQDGRGYGVIRRLRRSLKAHRFVWEECFGPIPEGMDLDHLCRNHACVNPLHLGVVTRAENIRRGLKTKLTPDQVQEIRVLRKNGIGQRQVEKHYGLSHGYVSLLERRKAWADLP